MCGEMAGDHRYTRLLLGLGLTEFSVHPAAILEIKHIINNSSVSDCAALADQLLQASEASQRRETAGGACAGVPGPALNAARPPRACGGGL